jgi:eukaryotic-like serine/threonine-protein kinase
MLSGDDASNPRVTVGSLEAADLNGTQAVEYAPGELVTPKYRLERPLGVGGQATVWAARNLTLDVAVALKLLLDGTADEAQVGRLLQEAKTVARLGHPAIVRVFDLAQTHRGEWFIVMELLEGKSLADELLERGRLPASRAVQLLLPIVHALAAAHAQGVVHRDVKPDNIFLTPTGASIQPKLLDFGIAKRKRDPQVGLQTAAGTILGTPAYLSPEQAEGLPDVDQRSDIWSLSATLYECVTGQLPFDAATDAELFAQIAEHEPPSILEHAAGDAALGAIVRRGLAKSREARWPSMHAFGEALASWLVTQGVNRDASGVSLDTHWSIAREAREHGTSTLSQAEVEGRFPAAARTATGERRSGALPLVVGGAVALGALGFVVAQPRSTGASERTAPRPLAAAPRPVEQVVPAAPAPSAVPAPAPVAVLPLSVVPPVASSGADAKPKLPRERPRQARPATEDQALDLLSPYR